ncbi:DsbA family oxidoreductase [Microbacterium sp. Clip185]|uniref:DsbA family oxidoreductase n=1 Tax=Microbacterium sp. Clip185 TaxID=3025663 RepID=UPI002365BECF|nr:DsbA family oxidoreductase [Microbacterium sp. Clip185]WDG17800.1 DsbA family oxidoreductase [Microbacterium sp. Clip185]
MIASGTPVRVDVWSDVQCIWCYIAGARLRAALERSPVAVDVVYRSFQLSPDAPVEIDREAHIRRHGGDAARMAQMLAHLERLTTDEGLEYRPDRTRPTNSRAALELLHQAQAEGRRAELTQRLFEAHFAEGRHIGLVDELLAIAGEVGLDRASAAASLADARWSTAVDADVREARRLGARGVPFYVIGGVARLSGAPSVDDLLAAFEHASRAVAVESI